MKILNLLLLGLVITGCATGYNPSYYYSNIEVANLSGDTIRNLKVQVGPGGTNPGMRRSHQKPNLS